MKLVCQTSPLNLLNDYFAITQIEVIEKLSAIAFSATVGNRTISAIGFAGTVRIASRTEGDRKQA